MRIKVAYLMLGLLIAVAFGATGCSSGGGGAGGATAQNVGVTAAKAGAAQDVFVGTLVTLDGSQSTAADGCQLTKFQWSFASMPAGSAAALQDSTRAKSTFIPDLPGQYSIKLSVTDTDSDSSQDTVTVTAVARNAGAPVAKAGTAQNVVTGTLVRLDGSASSAANGATLTYSWSFSSLPNGSGASLTGPTAVNPTFTPDLAGAYVVALTVNDGKQNSAAATVTITATAPGANAVPVANAGPAQTVTIGTAVTLDGSASSDADGDLLTYRWAFNARPAGSGALLTGAAAPKPGFTPDVAGAYVVSLVVNDGKADSAAATVTVTAYATGTNVPPVADAGAAQNVLTGNLVTLDGSGSSDANGDALTYRWAFTSIPAGSGATLSNPTAVKPTFIPDVAGSYVFNLVVNDGALDSAAATVAITASDVNAAPVANAGADQSAVTGALVTLDGRGSSDADGDPLTYSWAFTSKPAGSGAALSNAALATPSFTPDVAGSYVCSLVVSDGKLNSAAAHVTVTAVTVPAPNNAPVAKAGADRTVVVGTPVTLDGSGSSDADGDPLTYRWALASGPSGSSAKLSSATAAKPSFSPDAVGTYLFSLIVNDGKADSAAATVSITSIANNGSISIAW